MANMIQSPAKGQPMTAAWGVAVTEACNAMRAAGFGGTLARDGAGAFGNAPLPENQRNRRAAASDLGCYRIVLTSRDVEGDDGSTSSESVHGFDNCYVMLGGILAKRDVDTILEDLYDEAGDPVYESDDGKEKTMPLFLALRTLASPPATDDPETSEDETESNKTEVVGFGDIAGLTEAQADEMHHHIPLYLLNVTERTEDDGKKSYSYSIVCDFRRGVFAQQWEVI